MGFVRVILAAVMLLQPVGSVLEPGCPRGKPQDSRQCPCCADSKLANTPCKFAASGFVGCCCKPSEDNKPTTPGPSKDSTEHKPTLATVPPIIAIDQVFPFFRLGYRLDHVSASGRPLDRSAQSLLCSWIT